MLYQGIHYKGNPVSLLIDEQDVNFIKSYTWYLNKRGYLYRNTTEEERKTDGVCKDKKTVMLHRQIAERMGLDTSVTIDHKDGNPLNNCRDNLRFATVSQNSRNTKLYVTNSSGYKGLSWDKVRETWIVSIKVNYKQKYLGSFLDPVEGAKIYDKAALEYFGEFARLNFPVA